MEFATETKYRALMYDLSRFQKCNFHPNPMMAKFYTIGTQLPCTFSTKFGHQQNQIKITFLESLNIIYQRPVLRSCRKFGSLPKNCSSTLCCKYQNKLTYGNPENKDILKFKKCWDYTSQILPQVIKKQSLCFTVPDCSDTYNSETKKNL